MALIPIQYRDFYDIPRAFIVEREGKVFFFDGGFDEHADEYAESFRVYQLNTGSSKVSESESWQGLADKGTLVGEVPVGKVEFDPTRRAAVNDAVFDLLQGLSGESRK